MASEVVGRREELAALEGFLDEERLPGALLLEGEAGIGKTTLWRAGVDSARGRGWLVLVARAADSELELPFVGLGDLLRDHVAGLREQLPSPQRRALEAALLLAEPGDTPPARHTISAAVLSSLRALAGEQPVLLAVDDVQWLDDATTAALEYTVRRLADERVGLLLGWRTDGGETLPLGLADAVDASVTRLPVGPLTLGAVHQLLTERLGHPLARPTLVRVQETSAGNPFYALELARALERHEGPLPLREPLPVPSSLAGLIAERLDALPKTTIRALETATLMIEPTVSKISAALERTTPPSFESAVAAGIIVISEERVRFTHPLLEAAIGRCMSPAARRRLHRRLARVVETPEQKAHHLALGSERPDETTASTIEEAAAELVARGAPAFGAELFDEAARLTPADDLLSSCRRLIAAGQAWYRAFNWNRARVRARQVLDEAAAREHHADALLLLITCRGDPQELAELILAEAKDDPALRARAWTLIADHELNIDGPRGLETARRAVADAELAGDGALLAQALAVLGVVETVLCEGQPREHLDRAVELERGLGGVDPAFSPTLALAENAFARDELDLARTLFESSLRSAAEAGDDGVRAHVLWLLADVEWKAGRVSLAEQYLAESLALHEDSGHVLETATVLLRQGLYAGVRGDESLVAAKCREACALVAAVDLASSLIAQDEARIRILLDLGYERRSDGSALDASPWRLNGWVDPGLQTGVPDYVEALTGAGRVDEAAVHLREWEALGSRLDRPRVLATGARCRGLLLAARGDREAALDALERALVEHERLPVPFERARTLLVLGGQRRRLKRRAEAREALQEALAIFEELGAEVWAERARRELARIPGRRSSDRDELTEAERRIAELVAEGRSNKEVAATLFVTVKTVEASLTRIYRKLGVRSRAELAHRLAGVAAKP